MAWSGSSFNLWNDSALTSAFSGTLSIINKTNLSDNPQIFNLWLGSPTSNRALKDSTSPGTNNITITPIDTLPTWQATTAYLLGNDVKSVSSNGFVYQCTTAGTSGSTEPTWPISGFGSTVVDGTIVWTLVSAHHPKTEVTLALTSGALATNTPGAALSVGTIVNSTAANAVEIWIKVVNTVTNVANNAGNPEIGLQRSAVIEVAV